MITREQLLQVLDGWQSGDMNELAVWQWGEQARTEIRRQLQDAEPEVDGLVRDIVDLLAALPYEMLVTEDLQVLTDALSNPVEETDLSQNLLWNHMDAVDVDARRMQFAEHPFYGQFSDAD